MIGVMFGIWTLAQGQGEPSDAPLWLSGAVALSLAAVHIFERKLEFIHRVSRSRWLSFAGGISVGYVFLHLIPELAGRREHFQGDVWGVPARQIIYTAILAGLVIFYGLERLAVRSRGGRREASTAEPWIFWTHAGSFALYNLVIGYLLVRREDESVWALLLFGLAIGLHSLVIDNGLREHHQHRYHDRGRWIFAGAVIAGWAIGAAVQVWPQLITILLAAVAGAVVLNTLKEELPEQRESRFWAFAAGAAFYSALLLTMEAVRSSGEGH